MEYNQTFFDTYLERRGTRSSKWDGCNAKFGVDSSVELLPMWIADMDFRSPTEVVEALAQRVQTQAFGYTTVPDSFYDAILSWVERRYHWKIQKEWIVFTPGVVPAFNVAYQAFTQPGDGIIVPSPSYYPFFDGVRNNGRKVVACPLVEADGYWTLDFDLLEQQVKDPDNKVLILSNPHNPTGRIWTEEELRRVGEIAVRHDLWLISDEIHCDLLRSGVRHVPLGKVLPDYEKLVTCMAPSKTFNMAGLMISNVLIRSRALRHTWRTVHSGTDNPLSLAAAQAAYEQGGPWLEELLVYLDENFRFVRDYLAQHLPLARFRIPQATYLAWVDLSRYFVPGEDLARFLAYQAGVLVDDGPMFVQNAEGFVRLNLAAPRSVVAEGLRRICWAVNTKIQYTGLLQG